MDYLLHQSQLHLINRRSLLHYDGHPRSVLLVLPGIEKERQDIAIEQLFHTITVQAVPKVVHSDVHTRTTTKNLDTGTILQPVLLLLHNPPHLRHLLRRARPLPSLPQD